MIKIILGLALCIIGVLFGLYIGIWVCFIGGIVQVIEQIRAENLEPLKVALGIARVFFTGLAGWLSAIIFIIPGWGLITYTAAKSKRF